MTNFDKFLSAAEFEPFASVAVAAERILHIDPSACVLNCRRAMEFAVKWMYSVDKALVMPYQDTLVRGFPRHRRRGYLAADGLYPPRWQQRRPHRQKDHRGAGGAMSGKPLCVSGLRGLLLRRKLYREPF